MSLIGTAPRKLNESGQAVVEYVLVLCISVFMIVTFVYQFSTAFRVYANNFFGEYVSCLMETGELPGQTGGQCASSFIAFDLKNGTTATGGTGPVDTSQGGGSGGLTGASGSGSGGKGNSGRTTSSKGGSKGANGSSSDSKTGGGGSGSSSPSGGETIGSSSSDSGSSFGSSKSTRKTSRVSSASQAGAGQQKGKEGLKALSTSTTNYGRSESGSSGRRVALGRGYSYVGQDKDELQDRGGATKAVGKNEGNNLKSKRVSAPVVRAPAAASDGGDTSFTVGGFIKVLLIAAILIAIFVLFGGQLLAISKGGEK